MNGADVSSVAVPSGVLEELRNAVHNELCAHAIDIVIATESGDHVRRSGCLREHLAGIDEARALLEDIGCSGEPLTPVGVDLLRHQSVLFAALKAATAEVQDALENAASPPEIGESARRATIARVARWRDFAGIVLERARAAGVPQTTTAALEHWVGDSSA